MSLHCSWTRIYIKWEGKSEKCSAEKCGREGDLKFLEERCGEEEERRTPLKKLLGGLDPG